MIGDIHGRACLLRRLLRTFSPQIADSVVFLGDYIDRGPASRDVVETLIAFRESCPASVRFLMGNHERTMLKSLDDPCRHTWITGMHGLTTIRSYSSSVADEFEKAMTAQGSSLFEKRVPLPYDAFVDAMPNSHRAFYRDLLLFYRSQDVTCVHAGVSIPYQGVEAESEGELLWGSADWWDDYAGHDTIAYGHWSNAIDSSGRPSPFARNGTYGIDCSKTDDLIAVRFPDLHVFRASESSD